MINSFLFQLLVIKIRELDRKVHFLKYFEMMKIIYKNHLTKAQINLNKMENFMAKKVN